MLSDFLREASIFVLKDWEKKYQPQTKVSWLSSISRSNKRSFSGRLASHPGPRLSDHSWWTPSRARPPPPGPGKTPTCAGPPWITYKLILPFLLSLFIHDVWYCFELQLIKNDFIRKLVSLAHFEVQTIKKLFSAKRAEATTVSVKARKLSFSRTTPVLPSPLTKLLYEGGTQQKVYSCRSTCWVAAIYWSIHDSTFVKKAYSNSLLKWINLYVS